MRANRFHPVGRQRKTGPGRELSGGNLAPVPLLATLLRPPCYTAIVSSASIPQRHRDNP